MVQAHCLYCRKCLKKSFEPTQTCSRSSSSVSKGQVAVTHCRDSWVNAEAGVQVDAEWSLSPEKRNNLTFRWTRNANMCLCFGILCVPHEFTSFLSDLLRYMLNSSTLLVCKSLIARIWSPLWNRHTVCC